MKCSSNRKQLYTKHPFLTVIVRPMIKASKIYVLLIFLWCFLQRFYTNMFLKIFTANNTSLVYFIEVPSLKYNKNNYLPSVCKKKGRLAQLAMDEKKNCENRQHEWWTIWSLVVMQF